MSDGSYNMGLASQIVWVGAVRADPFYQSVSQRHSVLPCDSAYEALGQFVVGPSSQATGVVVVNASVVTGTLERFWGYLGQVSRVDTAILYSLPRRRIRVEAGLRGRIRLSWVNTPAELTAVLSTAISSVKPVDSPQESDSDRHRWPDRPPAVVLNAGQTGSRAPARARPASPTTGDKQLESIRTDNGTKDTELEPASLTEAELRALLGPELDNG